jgi:hypothetical protein
MFAIAQTANAAGAGGTCEALLHCNTAFLSLTSSNFILNINTTTGTSRFVAKIDDNAGAHGGQGLDATHVPYDTISAGDESNINVQATTELGQIRLFNSTRGTYRLITAADTANNVITTVNSADAWADNDDIDIESQLCTAPGNDMIEMDTSQTTDIPGLTRILQCQFWKRDSGAVGQFIAIHPYDTYSNTREAFCLNQAAHATLYLMTSVPIPISQRRFCTRWNASGAGTAAQTISLLGVWVAAP